MIGYLNGKVIENSDGKVLVGVGSDETGFIGYSVSVPQTAGYELLAQGQKVEFHVYTHIREDAFDLYGFSTRVEKELFLTLLSVNGIGPKGAMGILSGSDPEQLIHAILEGDKVYLTQIPGIGKKTAERVVLELADPLRKKVEAGLFSLKPRSQSAASARAQGGPPSGASASESAIVRDARAALVGLGFRENDVMVLLNRVLAEASPRPTQAEDLIRSALRQLS